VDQVSNRGMAILNCHKLKREECLATHHDQLWLGSNHSFASLANCVDQLVCGIVHILIIEVDDVSVVDRRRMLRSGVVPWRSQLHGSLRIQLVGADLEITGMDQGGGRDLALELFDLVLLGDDTIIVTIDLRLLLLNSGSEFDELFLLG
jgi:hypothetical protein